MNQAFSATPQPDGSFVLDLEPGDGPVEERFFLEDRAKGEPLDAKVLVQGVMKTLPVYKDRSDPDLFWVSIDAAFPG